MNAVVHAQATRRHLLSGNEAVARAAWEAGVRVAAAYPGTPATEILESIARYPDIYSEWSVNEKVAVEVAIGASLAGSRALAAMKKTGIFVNISRGDVVDEAALIEALQAGRIAGAGLDVYEFEPEVPAALRAMENVTLLPHLGTACLEVREAMGMMAVDNLIAFAEGRDPPNLIAP